MTRTAAPKSSQNARRDEARKGPDGPGERAECRARAGVARGGGPSDPFHEYWGCAAVAAGGTADGFAQAWPGLRDEYLTERTRANLTAREQAVQQAGREMAASSRYRL